MNEIQGWFGDLRALVLVGSGTMLLIAVVAVGLAKRSLLAAFGMLLGGALLLWGMANSDWLRDRAGDDFDTAPVTVLVDPVLVDPVVVDAGSVVIR
jgi:hypothetical protein